MQTLNFARRFFLATVVLACIPCLNASVFAQQPANSTAQTTPQQGTTQSAAQADPKQRQAVIDSLVGEMDDLIPGDYADGSAEQKKLIEVANFFIERNEQKVRAALGELTIADPNVPPQELIMAGLAYAANNQTQGKAILEQAAILHRDHPGIALAFARLALLQSRYFDSLALSEKARTTNRTSKLSAQAKQFYESEILDVMTVIELRRNQLESAEQSALAWEKLNPNNDKMLIAAAEIQFLRNKPEAAVGFLNRRSDKVKQDFPTAGVMGKWYLGKNDLAAYEEQIQKAYSSNPNSGFVQIEYAASLLRKENFEQAMKIVDGYEASNGASSQSKLIRGRIAFSMRQYAPAGALFAGLFQEQPNNLEHSYLYALTLLENPNEKQQRQGLQLAQRNYQLNPNNQLTTSILAWALYKNGSKEVAMEIVSRAAKASPLVPDAAYLIARMLTEEGRGPQAKVILKPYVDSPAIFLYRARAKELLVSIEAEAGQSADALPDPSK